MPCICPLFMSATLDAREKMSDLHRTSVVTPGSDDDNDEPFDESEDDDYNPVNEVRDLVEGLVRDNVFKRHGVS